MSIHSFLLNRKQQRVSRTLDWSKEFSYDATIKVLKELALSHARDSGPYEGFLRECITSSDFPRLCDYAICYGGSDATVSHLINVRQALAFFQKLETLDLGVDKEAIARSKFFETEAKCCKTNAKFSRSFYGETEFSPVADLILHQAQRKIARLLGRCPALSELDLRFGPGATTSTPRRKASAGNKLAEVPSCSADMLTLVSQVLAEIPEYTRTHSASFISDDEWEVYADTEINLHYGKLQFVPKNAKTYRSIVVEPPLNTLVQSGIGRYIAKRLLSVGQDIHDQSRNQRLAREGSLTGALATLDLSSASDLISTGLVEFLLPTEWYALLSMARTGTLESAGIYLRLQKFSSMGNGFTFPLETLIFWALTQACADHLSDVGVVSVYGDDIICSTRVVPLVLEVFEEAGFVINKAKSYWEGPFRESCGADYFAGIDIRPCYIKRNLSYEDLFRLHNFYVATLDKERAEAVLSMIPSPIRLWGPPGFGDGHLHSDAPLQPYGRKKGWAGYIFDTYTKKGRVQLCPSKGARVLPSYSIYVSDGSGDRAFTPHKGISEDQVLPVISLPGTRGYKRISIYTLAG